MPDWLSDALCRLSTGGGYSTRALYTDNEEIFFDASRPALLTSIGDVIRRADLADRCVDVVLEPISPGERRREADLWADFEAQAPAILGCLLDAVAGGLAQLPSVAIPEPPRMTDFCYWAESVCRAAGSPENTFLNAYVVGREDANRGLLEDSPLFSPLQELAKEDTAWKGTATQLLLVLEGRAGEKVLKSKRWPKSPRALSGALRALAPLLRGVGIHVEFDTERDDAGKTRMIAITRTDPDSEPPSERQGEFAFPAPPAPQPRNLQGKSGGANGGTNQPGAQVAPPDPSAGGANRQGGAQTAGAGGANAATVAPPENPVKDGTKRDFAPLGGGGAQILPHSSGGRQIVRYEF